MLALACYRDLYDIELVARLCTVLVRTLGTSDAIATDQRRLNGPCGEHDSSLSVGEYHFALRLRHRPHAM
jgi:hypothetical protein